MIPSVAQVCCVRRRPFVDWLRDRSDETSDQKVSISNLSKSNEQAVFGDRGLQIGPVTKNENKDKVWQSSEILN